MKLSRTDRGSLSAWNSALRSGLGLRVLGSVGRFWVRFSFWVWVEELAMGRSPRSSTRSTMPWRGGRCLELVVLLGILHENYGTDS